MHKWFAAAIVFAAAANAAGGGQINLASSSRTR
jgi:hypothetical protein